MFLLTFFITIIMGLTHINAWGMVILTLGFLGDCAYWIEQLKKKREGGDSNA